MDAIEWQTWSNPEFPQFDTGIRLEFQPPEVRERALALIEASLSPDGFRLVRDMMLINGFLGEVVGLETILIEFSYNFALYGSPDLVEPWGRQLFGHHCAVNCLVVEGRMVLSPVFLGAEPNEIDAGPRAGTAAFTDRIRLGTDLMAALPPDLRAATTVYRRMADPEMPPGRVHPGDERHLAGAFQDNRVIPVEGLRAADMPERPRRILRELVESFVSLLPDGPCTARMREIRDHLDATWFSWIGGHAAGDVFYYRIQSPVLTAELPRLRHPEALPHPHRGPHSPRKRLRPRLAGTTVRLSSGPSMSLRPSGTSGTRPTPRSTASRASWSPAVSSRARRCLAARTRGSAGTASQRQAGTSCAPGWASPEAHARFHEDAEALYEKQREDILARRLPVDK